MADIDSVNILCNLLYSNKSIVDAVTDYYTDIADNKLCRILEFVTHMGGKSAFENLIAEGISEMHASYDKSIAYNFRKSVLMNSSVLLKQ